MTALTLIGLAIAAAGFCALVGILVEHRSLGKLKQLGLLRAVLGGKHGRRQRAVLILAIAAQIGGVCTSFGGVAQRSARRATACRAECGNRGYRLGEIRGSRDTYRDGKGVKHLFVACACTGGPTEELELRADTLVF